MSHLFPSFRTFRRPQISCHTCQGHWVSPSASQWSILAEVVCGNWRLSLPCSIPCDFCLHPSPRCLIWSNVWISRRPLPFTLCRRRTSCSEKSEPWLLWAVVGRHLLFRCRSRKILPPSLNSPLHSADGWAKGRGTSTSHNIDLIVDLIVHPSCWTRTDLYSGGFVWTKFIFLG